MKPLHKVALVATLFVLFLYGFVSLPSPTRAYYGCGAGPCNGSFPCDSPYSCNPDPGGVCGVFYNTCSGAFCQTDSGWDSSPCTTGDACNPGGSTATATWSGCDAACGDGNLHCNAGVVNGCTVRCTAPDAAIGGTTPCCVPQAPINTPSSVNCAQANPLTRTANVTWSFPNGTGCGQPFGRACPANNNRFEMRFSGGKSTEIEAGGTTPYAHTTGLFPDWGTYSVTVCALNGFSETCAAPVNCVLTPPTCSSSGMDVTNASPDDTCIAVNPDLRASWGNNANQLNFYVDTTNPLASPYTAQAGPYGSSPASYSPVLGTGQYFWTVRTYSDTAPLGCITPAVFPTGMEINIDKTDPGIPVMATPALSPDGACLSNYRVTYSWSAVTDADCAGLAPSPYQIQIANNAGYSPVIVDARTNLLSRQTTNSYPGGTVLYGRVEAWDSVGNFSDWSATQATAFTVPTPTPYPTIRVWGRYEEDVGASTPSCVGGMTIDPNNLVLDLNISGIGATTTCNKYASTFECFVTIDNQSTPCAVPAHTAGLAATYDGYEAVEWRTGNACGGTPMPTIGIDFSNPLPPGTSPTPIQTFFKYGAQSWFKSNAISFNNRSQRNNIIPNNTLKFDATNDDDVGYPNNKHLIIGAGGAVLQDMGEAINLGANAEGYSENDWYHNTYPTSSLFTPAKFADYMKSRKQYKTITSTANITGDGVYYVDSNLTISGDGDFDNRKVIIVADQGTVTVNANIIPANGSLAIIANNIVIGNTVTEVDAILVGNQVSVASVPTILGLKIVGNLIQLTDTPQPFVNNRISPDARRPSLFIKFDQQAYLNLLPYLSVSVYDWKQVQ